MNPKFTQGTQIDLKLGLSEACRHGFVAPNILGRSVRFLHLLLCRSLRIRHARFYQRVSKRIQSGQDICSEAGWQSGEAEEIVSLTHSTNSISARLSM